MLYFIQRKEAMGVDAKRKAGMALVLNFGLLVLEIIGTAMSIMDIGCGIFLYFTDYSNILSLLASALMCFYLAGFLKNGSAIPMWLRILKYMSVCCLTVTLLVVVFVLSPMLGEGGLRWSMLYGDMLYHHFLCPVLAIVIFLFFEHDPPLEKCHTYYGLIPVSIYAVVFIILNLFRVVEGPYPFLMYYKQPVYESVFWTIVIPVGAYFIAMALRKLNSALK